MNKYLLAIIILFTSGCGVRNEYIVSEAQLSIGKDINYSKIDYPDVALHLRLYNDIQTFKSKTIVVAPIEYNKNVKKHISFYSSNGSNYDFNNEFRILLAVLPKESGFMLDLRKLTLSVDGVNYLASSAEGPINYFPYYNFAFPKNLSEEYQKKRVEEGYVFSMNQGKRKELLGKDIVLNKIGLWHCYEIVFNIPTPSPKQNIKLDISGLYKNNSKYKLSSIEFKDGYFIDVGSIP